jgi:hypothetical protein
MARLPTRGSTVSTPLLGKVDLRRVLHELCPGADFSESDIQEFYRRLGRIIGQWSAEHSRLDIAPLVKTLTLLGSQLTGAAKTLSGHETGLHEIHDIEIVSQLTSILALDPEVGTRLQADKMIASFRNDAAKIAHACLVTAHDLDQQVGKSGRPPSEWYDDFTPMLLEIAKLAGVEPRLLKNRISGEREGWLVDAAWALEALLDPEMRSPTREACGKRLERSLKTIKQLHRQNPPSA